MEVRSVPTSFVLGLMLSTACPTLVGCGGATATVEHPEADERAIDLTLRTTDGRIVELADQRGSPVLIVAFASYDDGSQAVLREVGTFARQHLDVLVLGLMVQPDAATFAPLFDETMHPPFAIVYDERGLVAEGNSSLGGLPAIPCLYAIDGAGRLRGRHVGYASLGEIEALVLGH